MALNYICLQGRLTADPELKQTPSGVAYCKFTIAVDRAFKKGEEKQTDFFAVTCWRWLAEMVAKNFAKGKEMIVCGEMHCQKWQDAEGATKSSWSVDANSIYFCGSKGIAEKPAILQPPLQNEFVEVNPDDVLPF